MYDVTLHAEKIANPNINDACICQNTNDKPYIMTNTYTQYKYKNKEKNPVIDGKFDGGTYILFPDDIAFAWYTKESILGDVFLELIRFLKSENVPVSVDGNDIMINDKKLLGTMSTSVENGYYEGCFFCFKPDIELIKSVCTKPMQKVPVGLLEFNIKPYMIIEFCRRMIRDHELNEL